MPQPNFKVLLTVELPGAIDFHNITLKVFRTSQLLTIDALPVYYPHDLLRHGAPFGCHPFQTGGTRYSGDIITTNYQRASVSTLYVRINIWISAAYVEASKTTSIFYGPVCSRKKLVHAFCNLLRSLPINHWIWVRLHLL
ncbi:hypothetical protein RMCBS344292_04876 [Rhizopus microsporus]|nr:hypothetical protein RMCBS344292_04876 [Rhizopus microsporus]